MEYVILYDVLFPLLSDLQPLETGFYRATRVFGSNQVSITFRSPTVGDNVLFRTTLSSRI